MASEPDEAVVVGHTTTPQAREAVWWAAFEAASRGQPMRVVHVFAAPLEQLTRMHPPSEAIEPGPLRDAVEQELESLVAECRERLPGLDVRAEVSMGHPAKVLGEATSRSGLLVLGAPRSKGARRVLLGSTAAELTRKAHVPVVMVRGERESQRIARSPEHFDRIVVGVDGSPASVRAIGFAHDFAARHDADLLALLAWNELPTDAIPPSSGWKLDWGDVTAACQRELAESMAGWGERYPTVTARQEVTTTQLPTEALLTAADEADLLIVGTRGRGVVHTALFGSVSHGVVHYAPCPVAVVR